jgi:Predicted nucleotide-binding protein containing TIR-like domain
VDKRLREIALISSALGSAIAHDSSFFGPISEYGRRLAAFDIEKFDRESLDELSLVADKVDRFFGEYRRTPGTGLYLEPAQISGSNSDLGRLRQLIADLEPLGDSVLTAMTGPKTAGPSGTAAVRPLEHAEQTAAHPLFKKVALPSFKTASGGRPSDRGAPATPRVFVVHGHDHGARDAVARLLTSLKLDPVILAEQPNKGRTIIEKFEAYADVVFAVVVLSPDDVGGAVGGEQRPRARQNVVLELGFFIGKLGRARVAAVRIGDIEEPADVNGVVYIAFDSGGAWKTKLARELQAAQIQVDLNNIQ